MDLVGWLKGLSLPFDHPDSQGNLPDNTWVQDIANRMFGNLGNAKDSEGRSNVQRKRALKKATGPSPEEMQQRLIRLQNAQEFNAPGNVQMESKFARMVRILNNGKK